MNYAVVRADTGYTVAPFKLSKEDAERSAMILSGNHKGRYIAVKSPSKPPSIHNGHGK